MKIKCPACNFENEEGVKFCGNCGRPILGVKDSEIKREKSYTEKENKEHYNNNLGLNPKNKKTKPSYFIPGLILFLCILAYFLGPRLGWFLTPSYTTLRVSSPGTQINTDDPDYPLEFISDGYKFTSITKDRVNWVWQYTVLNKSDRKLKVSVTFKLMDKDNFIISSSYYKGMFSVGENVVDKNSDFKIKGEGNIPIYDLKRVHHRSWSLGYSEI